MSSSTTDHRYTPTSLSHVIAWHIQTLRGSPMHEFLDQRPPVHSTSSHALRIHTLHSIHSFRAEQRAGGL